MKVRSLVVATCLSVALLFPVAQAQSQASRASARGSEGLSLAAGSIVAGSAVLIVGGAQLVVEGVQHLGESMLVVLRPVGQGLSEASTVTLKFFVSAVGGISLALGTTVQVVAEASGHALYYAGKLIAFIPNEVGRSLLHHSPVKMGE